jgi:hypothetical protein
MFKVADFVEDVFTFGIFCSCECKHQTQSSNKFCGHNGIMLLWITLKGLPDQR